MDLRYEELGPSSDLVAYERLAGPEMFPADFMDAAALEKALATGELRAWFVWDGESRVGWCSLRMRSPVHPLSASHVSDLIVFADLKGRGYGSAMVGGLVKMFADVPLTASVRPGNLASEASLRRNGFRRGLPDAPFVTWHRPAPAWSTKQPVMILLEAPAAAADSTLSFSQSNRVDFVLRTLRAQRCYVEAALGAPPVARHGMSAPWPDPAAFPIRLTVGDAVDAPDVWRDETEAVPSVRSVRASDLTDREVSTVAHSIVAAYGQPWEARLLQPESAALSRRTIQRTLDGCHRVGLVFLRGGAVPRAACDVASLPERDIISAMSGRDVGDATWDQVDAARREVATLVAAFAGIGIAPYVAQPRAIAAAPAS